MRRDPQRAPSIHSFLYSDDPPTGVDVSGADPKAVPSSVFECWRCNRLIEARQELGTVVAPKACPSCGKSVSSIAGREIDGYQLEEEIAAGGFGIIYLASNVAQREMKAVVKLLRPSLANRRPELVKVFVEEARLTEEIGQTCWNIVRVFNVREKPWPYFFMEYVRGTTLNDVIEASSERKVPIADAKGYLRGIARALAATHSRGRVHRDLKPANVMVIASDEIARPEERVKLLDFGLALKIATREMGQVERVTPSGELPAGSPLKSAGTPEYMAPEAYDGVNDFAADIYSFGVTAYEVLTGALPWDEPAAGVHRFVHWRDSHKQRAPRPVRELRPDAPAWLAKLVMQCLEKSPAKRVASAAQLVERLREPTPTWIWLAAVAALCLFGLLGWLAFRGGETRVALRWTVDGAPSDGERLTVWASSARDLPSREISARSPDKKALLECRSADPRISCEVSDGQLRVRLPADDALLGESIGVEGRGDGFRFSGVIDVRRDDAPPAVIGVQAVDAKGNARDLEPGARVRTAETALHARAREQHFKQAYLRGKRRAGGVAEIQGTHAAAGDDGESTCVFSLKGLEAGEWEIRFEIEDAAGNKTLYPPDPLPIVADGSVDVLPTQGWKCWIALRKAWYELRSGDDERIATVEVKDAAGGNVLPVELREPPNELASAADLIDERPAIDPGRWKPGEKVLLAIQLPSGGAPRELLLRITDAAFPPNELVRTLVCRPGAPIARDDLTAVSLALGDAESPVTLDRDAFRDAADGGLALKEPLFLRQASLETIAARTREGKALRGTLRANGAESKARLAADSLTFGPIALTPDARNEIELALVDGMENHLRVALAVQPDTIPPRTTARLEGVEPAGHFRALELASILVESAEPLAEIHASSGRKRIDGALVSGGDGASTYRLDHLERLDLTGDGEHVIRIEARDRASNAAKPLEQKLIIDSGPPRVAPLSKLDANGTLLLTQDRCLWSAQDPNSIDASTARCRVEYASGPKKPLTSLVLPMRHEEGDVYSLALGALPDRCAGFITPLVSDLQGVQTGGSPGKDRLSFIFTRPEPSWKTEVAWKGMQWVRVDAAKKFYVTKTEVPNKVFRAAGFFKDGAYADPKLASYGRPRYWGKRGELPTYVRADGTSVPGDDFPVTGISPAEAEIFSSTVFGARLPDWSEFLAAATLDNPGGKYPWRDEEAGKDWCNHRGTTSRASSALGALRCVALKVPGSGESVPAGLVEANATPSSTGSSPLRVWHLLGNARELVTLPGGSYAAAGGYYGSDYEQLRLDREPDRYLGDELDRWAKTGFRMVIPVDGAPKAFRTAAMEAEGR